MTGEVEGTGLKRPGFWKGWPMWTLGPSRIIIRADLEGVLLRQELGLLEMGQGREREMEGAGGIRL